jgi:hypothetical protein
LKIKLKGRIAVGAEHRHKHNFQDAFKKWQKFWERCIHLVGGYFEGDGVQ